MALYMFAYGQEPVVHPLSAQMRSAIPQIFGGTRPLTLFLVAGEVPRLRMKAMQQRGHAWLVAAWRHYQKACAP